MLSCGSRSLGSFHQGEKASPAPPAGRSSDPCSPPRAWPRCSARLLWSGRDQISCSPSRELVTHQLTSLAEPRSGRWAGGVPGVPLGPDPAPLEIRFGGRKHRCSAGVCVCAGGGWCVRYCCHVTLQASPVSAAGDAPETPRVWFCQENGQKSYLLVPLGGARLASAPPDLISCCS